MNPRDVLEFGPVRDDEIEQTNALLEQALTFPLGEMAQWTTEFGHENVRVVRRNGRVVSGMGIIPMGHYFGGRSVPAGGITAVGVAPDQRGSGVGLFMLQQSLIEQQRQGSPIATLYPATTNFYRRSGFERAAHRIIYEVPLAGVGVRDYTLDAAPAAPEEYALIKQLYAQKAAQSSALIDRPGFYWDTFLEPKTKRSYKFIVRRDGVPEGYVIFMHASFGEHLQVRDYVALTPDAGRRILTILTDHRSMVEHMRIPGGANDGLLFLMPEQRHKTHWSLDLMLRVLDVAGALTARGYLPGIQTELHLDVDDALLPNNRGRFVLRVADGRGTVEKGGSGTLKLDARALAALYTGYLTAQELVAAGMLQAPPEALAAAGLVFAGPRPWLPDMF